MSRKPSPQELYPNLFGEKPAPAKAAPRRPEEMRLFRWSALQAATKRVARPAEPRRASTPRPLPRAAQR
ncbi:MAG TPA: hypothetical protein V6D47_02405 [Oscillatoriaceae cyanobacterium]